MSEDIEEMLESKSKKRDKTFAEVEGLPANAHKRAKVKEEKSSKKGPTDNRKTFFTMNGHKFVRVDVKPNGNAYMTYLGKMKKNLGPAEARIEKERWDLEKKKWAKTGPWVQEYEAKDKIREAVAELNRG